MFHALFCSTLTLLLFWLSIVWIRIAFMSNKSSLLQRVWKVSLLSIPLWTVIIAMGIIIISKETLGHGD